MNTRDTTDLTALFAQKEGDLRKMRAGKEHPVLVVLDGRRTCRRYEIKKGEFTVGRDESCDLVLHDTNTSRLHARFFYANICDPEGKPQIFLADMDSTNGTFVNGKKVSTVELQNGDKVVLGKTLVGFFLWDDATLKAEDALLKSASTDALTGLYNRGYFQTTLLREFHRAVRYKRPLSLIFADIDHFKSVNDKNGHPAGDKVLMEVAAVISGNSRGNDFACRYGGEEIALLLPETPLAGAIMHASRLCEKLRAHSIALGAGVIQVTASFGVAELDAGMREAAELIKAADTALYRAKTEGRDRVCSHGTYCEESAQTEPLKDLTH